LASVSIIGSGFSGLAAAAMLAKQGHQVDVFEKNSSIGGRARQFQTNGFTFDMGPSWYWMPEIFDQFYAKFGYKTSDFYDLERLDPSYSVVFDDEIINIPASIEELYSLFESFEKGSAEKLKNFLAEAAYKYKAGMETYVWKPGKSLTEFADIEVFKSMFKLKMFSSVSSQIRKLFKDHRIIKILEFPVLFLGAKPANTPALYTLMNHADIGLGTWYPKGGMNKIVQAFERICIEQGVTFHTNSKVESFDYTDNKITRLIIEGQSPQATDVVLGSADYQHIDKHLLDSKFSQYSESYWNNRKLAPSSVLFYLGIDRKIPNLHHHTLFFDADFDTHADEIYQSHSWPSDPLFYVCSPSVSDDSVAPINCENLFILMPISTEIEDSVSQVEKYFEVICDRFNKRFKVDIRKHLKYRRDFSINDFKTEYNSFKGNAYGLANTLTQTGPLKPKMKNKNLSNLYYAGQLTVPGPGVPPSIISGQVAAALIHEQYV
jgi:phytoene desaturase